MTFVDASAIVAMVTEEPDGQAIAAVLDASPAPITSAIAIFEATLAVVRKRVASVADAQDRVDRYLVLAGVRVVAIAAEDAGTALLAFARYGKGGGHPAQLNMGDCFAYAVAKRHQATMLYKGQDFSATNVVRA